MAKNNDPKKIITGWDTRWSYCNVWEPKGIDGSKPAWSVSLIIPKSDKETLSKIEKAIQAAYEEGASILKGTGKTVPPLSAINSPLNDGDEKRSGDPAYENAYYLNAKNYQRAPGIVDKDRQDILDHSEVYSGVYGRACISFFAYNKNGNKGIGCSLHHLQKGRDGDPLGGFTRAEDEFDDGEEDFLS
jgi:hypothetical protein